MERKIVYQTKKQIIDKETGEITDIEKEQVIKIPIEEDYIKIYLKHISYIHNLPKGLHPLLYELIKYVNYDNEIVLNASVKKRIAEKIAVKINTIDHYLSQMVKKKILIRKDKGIYIMNPLFFGKGKWQNILELRQKLGINVVYKEGEIEIIELGIIEK